MSGEAEFLTFRYRISKLEVRLALMIRILLLTRRFHPKFRNR
jgi:hypothetical protein